jgi:hypothetical protein
VAVTIDQVAAFVSSLPDVTEGVSWGNRTWLVDGKGFAWRRPFSKPDLKRFAEAGETPPQGEILAVRVASLDAKDALLAIAPPGFFTIPHFDGYAGVLIALRDARIKDVRAAIVDALTAVAATPAKRPRKPRPRVRARARK